MYVREYPSARYSYNKEDGEFKLELDDPVNYVPWCSVDPYPSPENRESEMAKFPLYFNGLKPFEVTVKAGDILYLPSMWFHHVRQSPDSRGRTIAVNYWYDMQFDIKYAYFNFLQSIPHSLGCNPELPETSSTRSAAKLCTCSRKASVAGNKCHGEGCNPELPETSSTRSAAKLCTCSRKASVAGNKCHGEEE